MNTVLAYRWYVPYIVLHAALLLCAAFFAFTLWHGAITVRTNGDFCLYPPNFTVEADTVHVVRIVPLAGQMLRSPCASQDGTALALLW